MVEHEFFGRDKPSAEFQDRHGQEGRKIRGLTVEEYINRLGQDLIQRQDNSGDAQQRQGGTGVIAPHSKDPDPQKTPAGQQQQNGTE